MGAPSAGYSASSSNSSSAANRGVFGNAAFGGINFAALDSVPPSAFTGGGGTGSRTALWIAGGAVVMLGVVMVVALKKRK